MPHPTIQHEPLHVDAFTERCRAAGHLVLTFTTDGSLVDASAAGSRLLDRALAGFSLLHSLIRRHVAAWNEQQPPEPALAFTGCWLAPVAIFRRRRRCGYHVVVLADADIARGEVFAALCQSASLDQAASQTLAPTTRYDRADLDRWMRMFQALSDDLVRLERLETELSSLSQQLSETYEELSLVYKMAAHLTVTQDPAVFLADACAELRQVIGLRWVAVQLTDGDFRLKELAGRLLHDAEAGAPVDRLQSVGQEIVKRFGAGQTLIVDDAATLGVPSLQSMADKLMIVPIVRELGVLGVLIGADKAGGELTSVDSKLATTTAQNIGIFLENAMLYEDMQDMFMGTLHSLISSIDAKDAYTCGHSERVAWLSRELASAAGLDPQMVERVYLSGLVHDVGKIGVPEAVLCKAGRLSDEEYDLIKMHPEIGVRILKDIRQMQDLLPGVLHHHERWDGRGYPHKLAGEAIPVFGRIIAMADSFDAMSSDRTYRRAMPQEQAIAEIRRCAGVQFDPKLVAPFESIRLATYYQMVGQHQQRMTGAVTVKTVKASRGVES